MSVLFSQLCLGAVPAEPTRRWLAHRPTARNAHLRGRT